MSDSDRLPSGHLIDDGGADPRTESPFRFAPETHGAKDTSEVVLCPELMYGFHWSGVN